MYEASQAHMAKEVNHLTAREAQVTITENALERREDNVKRTSEVLERHQQTVMQLHHMTKEKLDSIRKERTEDDRLKTEIMSQNFTTRNQIKAEAAKVEGLIKKLRSLRSSIATPLHNCEAALANIKEQAQSLNLVEAKQQITSLKSELARISSHTDRHQATIRSIFKTIEALDSDRKRLMDRQFKDISANLANVSDISTGLTAKASEVTTGLDAFSTKFQEMQVAESNATEELRKVIATGSKAREALQQVLARSNAALFNDNITKRGHALGLSSPEKPAAKRRRSRHVRGSSVGAAEVLPNVEAPELLANTIQTFGSPSQRRIPSLDNTRTASGGLRQFAPSPVP